jgi:ankyrin repeat protein
MSILRSGSAKRLLVAALLDVCMWGQASRTGDSYKTIYDCQVGMDMAKAEGEGYVKVTYSPRGGSSGGTIDVRVDRVPEKSGNRTLCLAPPRGLRLSNSNRSEQAMTIAGFAEVTKSSLGMVVEKAVVALAGNTTSFLMEGYCAEIHKDNPSPSSTLLPGRVDPMLMCLSRNGPYGVPMNVADTTAQLTFAKQAAIWQYTDRASYGEFADRFRSAIPADKLSLAWNRGLLAVHNCQMISPATLLRDRAGWNDLSSIDEALLRGAPIDSPGPSGETALHRAADRGALAAMFALLEAGANINARTSSGATPLMSAVVRFKTEAVAFLLARGADPNLKDDSGSTALHFAVSAEGSGAAIVRALLDAGADVNGQDSDGATPLMTAVNQSNLDAVKLLLLHRADPKLKDHSGKAALDIAVESQSTPDGATIISLIRDAMAAGK